MSLEHLAGLIVERTGPDGCAAVALSGGVDSGLVAAAAHLALGERAMACTVVSELTPQRDLERASAVAAQIGIGHRVLQVQALLLPKVQANRPDRCYHCKCMVFQTIRDSLGQHCLLLDGTNADDDPARPGLKAVSEFGVFSPLVAAGMTKGAVRGLAREAGLPNWDAPADSCLATRIRTGTPLTLGSLSQVAAMESYLHDIGLDTVRVHPDNLVATVEYHPQYSEIIDENRDKIVALALRLGLRSCVFKEWRE